jgi:hypothetical protein
MVERGSPRGVRTAPRPIEKQAATVAATCAFRWRGRAQRTSTRMMEAMIAEMMLDTSPRPLSGKIMMFSDRWETIIAIRWIGACQT